MMKKVKKKKCVTVTIAGLKWSLYFNQVCQASRLSLLLSSSVLVVYICAKVHKVIDRRCFNVKEKERQYTVKCTMVFAWSYVCLDLWGKTDSSNSRSHEIKLKIKEEQEEWDRAAFFLLKKRNLSLSAAKSCVCHSVGREEIIRWKAVTQQAHALKQKAKIVSTGSPTKPESSYSHTHTHIVVDG